MKNVLNRSKLTGNHAWGASGYYCKTSDAIVASSHRDAANEGFGRLNCAVYSNAVSVSQHHDFEPSLPGGISLYRFFLPDLALFRFLSGRLFYLAGKSSSNRRLIFNSMEISPLGCMNFSRRSANFTAQQAEFQYCNPNFFRSVNDTAAAGFLLSGKCFLKFLFSSPPDGLSSLFHDRSKLVFKDISSGGLFVSIHCFEHINSNISDMNRNNAVRRREAQPAKPQYIYIIRYSRHATASRLNLSRMTKPILSLPNILFHIFYDISECQRFSYIRGRLFLSNNNLFFSIFHSILFVASVGINRFHFSYNSFYLFILPAEAFYLSINNIGLNKLGAHEAANNFRHNYDALPLLSHQILNTYSVISIDITHNTPHRSNTFSLQFHPDSTAQAEYLGFETNLAFNVCNDHCNCVVSFRNIRDGFRAESRKSSNIYTGISAYRAGNLLHITGISMHNNHSLPPIPTEVVKKASINLFSESMVSLFYIRLSMQNEMNASNGCLQILDLLLGVPFFASEVVEHRSGIIPLEILAHISHVLTSILTWTERSSFASCLFRNCAFILNFYSVILTKQYRSIANIYSVNIYCHVHVSDTAAVKSPRFDNRRLSGLLDISLFLTLIFFLKYYFTVAVFFYFDMTKSCVFRLSENSGMTAGRSFCHLQKFLFASLKLTFDNHNKLSSSNDNHQHVPTIFGAVSGMYRNRASDFWQRFVPSLNGTNKLRHSSWTSTELCSHYSTYLRDIPERYEKFAGLYRDTIETIPNKSDTVSERSDNRACKLWYGKMSFISPYRYCKTHQVGVHLYVPNVFHKCSCKYMV